MVVVLAMTCSSLSQWLPHLRGRQQCEGDTLLETSPRTLLGSILFQTDRTDSNASLVLTGCASTCNWIAMDSSPRKH
jgi:hypothetical protein